MFCIALLVAQAAVTAVLLGEVYRPLMGALASPGMLGHVHHEVCTCLDRLTVQLFNTEEVGGVLLTSRVTVQHGKAELGPRA